MLSQPAAPKGDEESPEKPKQGGKLRQWTDSPLTNRMMRAEFEALRRLRERLRRSSNRPEWWSSHVRSFFR